MTPERTARISSVLSHRQPDLTVVMENIHDPHNVAAVMRTCDAVGVQELFVLNTRLSTHSKFGKKSSASAKGWLTIHQFTSISECMNTLKERNFKCYATHLGKETHSLYELNLVEPVALVFGNEHSGVSDECVSYCDGNFIIPQVGMIKSLNVSVACAISLYEAFRQRQVNGYYNGEPRLPQDTYNQLSDRWGLYQQDAGNE